MNFIDMNIVGADDAKIHFPELLARVAEGETITITRDDTPVARLVPIKSPSSAEDRRDAIRSMREVAACNQLAGLRVGDLIAEGRR